MTTYDNGWDDMSDHEFWTRIALEATIGGDPGKALAMRIGEFFDDVRVRPRQRDAVLVRDISLRDIDEWLMSTEFDGTPEKHRHGVIIRDVEYTAPEEYEIGTMALQCVCGNEIPAEGTDFEPQCRHCERTRINRLDQELTTDSEEKDNATVL